MKAKKTKPIPKLYLSCPGADRWTVILNEMQICAEMSKERAVNFYYTVRNKRTYFDSDTDSFKLLDGKMPQVFCDGKFQPLEQ